MTTVKKMKEREEMAEQVRKDMYEDTAQDSHDDDGDQHDNQHDNQAAHDDDLQTSNLVEENRKLNEALKALQGKYNAEVPRLTQQLRDTQMQLRQAETGQVKAEEDAQKAYDKLNKQLASLRDDYGDEIVDVLETLAEQKKDTSQQVAGVDNEKMFWNNLYRRVPDLDQINVDPAFIAWLQQPTVQGGTNRQQELIDARDDLDYDSCAKIFDAFKHEQKTGKQPRKAEDFQSTPRSQKREPQAKKRYTPQDWVSFQKDVQKGRYRGREAEAAQLEREIHAAIHGS